jgi:hypothetical protein
MNVMLAVLGFSLSGWMSPSCDRQRVQELARVSEFVVLAEVVNQEPAFYVNDILPLIQPVKYKVIEPLKGRLVGDEINVLHYVIKGTASADKEQERLSPTLFAKNNRLILFLVHDWGIVKDTKWERPIQYLVYEPECGSLIASNDTVALVKNTLKESP